VRRAQEADPAHILSSGFEACDASGPGRDEGWNPSTGEASGQGGEGHTGPREDKHP